MAVTSGTVATLQLDVATIVETAFRRCGKLPSTIGGELIQAARLNLFLLLTNLANRGLSLWCVEKVVIPAIPGAAEYTLPLGTIDALSLVFRRTTAVALTKTVVDATTQVYTAPAAFDTLAVTSGSPKILVELSRDNGATWSPTLTKLLSGSADVPAGVNAVRLTTTEPVLPPLTLSAVAVGRETTLTKISRDRYLALPNKKASGAGESVQYWFDKQLPPVIRVWPTSDTADAAFALYTQRQIQDVATLTEAIEVPQRWYQAIIAQLAANMALELPPDELPPGRDEKLMMLAAAAISEAERGESDGAPMTFTPNIAGYTR
jgi:hypothetical protein